MILSCTERPALLQRYLPFRKVKQKVNALRSRVLIVLTRVIFDSNEFALYPDSRLQCKKKVSQFAEEALNTYS